MVKKNTYRSPWQRLLALPVLLVLSGCQPRLPSDITREKDINYELEMIIPADEMEEPLDVAALIHDIKEQVSTLEKGLKGDDPVFMETLNPLKQSLDDLETTLSGLDPVLKNTKVMIRDLQAQIDTINSQFDE